MKQILQCSAITAALAFSAFAQSPRQGVAADVMKVDEAYRLAKLHGDTRALDRILNDGFNETNQNGNSRNKAQTLDLWKSFSISSLTTDTFQVRVTGDTAMVTGTQTEDAAEPMLFTRVYVKRAPDWQLFASMQFRDPNHGARAVSAARKEIVLPPGIEGEVMKADEAFRLAKLQRDTAALGRILADSFTETNQNGNSRNKPEMIDLFKTFAIDSLTTDSFHVRLAGEIAVVTGTQTEDQTEHMLFTRVYVHGSAGWQLLSSTQFRNPNANNTV